MPSSSHDAIRSAFALGNLLLSAALIALVAAVSVRYLAVDVPALALAALLAGSAVGLLRQSAWWRPALQASAACALASGLCALSALALAVSYLGGVHGELGKSTVATWAGGTALLFPYLVVYPALQLLWIHSQRRNTP